jgi:hypothetical protein
MSERQVSDDGLWEWDGKRWVYPARLEIACGRCGCAVAVPGGKKGFKCPNGHAQDLVACKACRGTFQFPNEHRQYDVRCPHCAYASLYVTSVSAWDWAADQSAQGRWPLGREVTVDPDRRVLRDFVFAAGGGTGIPIGSKCLIDFVSDGARISAASGIEEFIRYSEIHALQISGSNSRTNAGAFGGGFGVVGAAEGILAASVINSLTSTSSVYSVVRVAARASEYVFSSHTIDSASLNMMLTPVQLRIRQAQPPPPDAQAALGHIPNATSSIADDLIKLAQLRDSGVLTDSEFAAAKARLLGNV